MLSTVGQEKSNQEDLNVDDFVGLGGTYGVLRVIASLEGVIESDHFPPKSIYEFAKHKDISDLQYNEDIMPALSLPYQVHKNFATTYAVVDRGNLYRSEFVTKLAELMAEGEYYEVVRLSVEQYRDNLGVGFTKGQPNNPKDRTATMDRYKKGILDALQVHVKLRMITEDQRELIVKEFNLRGNHASETATNNKKRKLGIEVIKQTGNALVKFGHEYKCDKDYRHDNPKVVEANERRRNRVLTRDEKRKSKGKPYNKVLEIPTEKDCFDANQNSSKKIKLSNFYHRGKTLFQRRAKHWKDFRTRMKTHRRIHSTQHEE